MAHIYPYVPHEQAEGTGWVAALLSQLHRRVLLQQPAATLSQSNCISAAHMHTLVRGGVDAICPLPDCQPVKARLKSWVCQIKRSNCNYTFKDQNRSHFKSSKAEPMSMHVSSPLEIVFKPQKCQQNLQIPCLTASRQHLQTETC